MVTKYSGTTRGFQHLYRQKKSTIERCHEERYGFKQKKTANTSELTESLNEIEIGLEEAKMLNALNFEIDSEHDNEVAEKLINYIKAKVGKKRFEIFSTEKVCNTIPKITLWQRVFG